MNVVIINSQAQEKEHRRYNYCYIKTMEIGVHAGEINAAYIMV